MVVWIAFDEPINRVLEEPSGCGRSQDIDTTSTIEHEISERMLIPPPQWINLEDAGGPFQVVQRPKPFHCTANIEVTLSHQMQSTAKTLSFVQGSLPGLQIWQSSSIPRHRLVLVGFGRYQVSLAPVLHPEKGNQHRE